MVIKHSFALDTKVEYQIKLQVGIKMVTPFTFRLHTKYFRYLGHSQVDIKKVDNSD